MSVRSHHVFYLLIALFLGLVTLLSGCIGEDGSAAEESDSGQACDCLPPDDQGGDSPTEIPHGTTTATADG